MPGNQNNEELAVKTPVLSLFFRGRQMFSVLLLIVLSTVFAYLTYENDAKATTRANLTDEKADSRAMVTVITLEKVEAAITRFEATQRVGIYVQSLTEEQRQKLNLMEPKELSAMKR